MIFIILFKFKKYKKINLMSLENKRKKTKSKDNKEIIILSKGITIKTLNNT